MKRYWTAARTYLANHRAALGAFVFGVLLTLTARFIYEKVLFPPEETVEIERLIEAEARYSLQAPCGADEYAALFTEGALVEDIRGKVNFEGRALIADRFRKLPPFKTLLHDLRDVPKIVGEASATAKTTSTIELAGERHTGREEWWFVRSEGGWKISRLRYNNP